MSLTDELQKLADLHAQGHLSDAEFSAAKARLLSQPAPTLSAPPPGSVAAKVLPTELIEEKVYWSSRWSSGNLFFRDRLTVGADGITFRKGAMFSSDQEHISYRSIASFKLNRRIFLADISIETSGGSQPIFVNGLWKSDAKEIESVVRGYQARHS